MRLVVFDVDGTLVDSQHEITSSMNAAMVQQGLPELPRDQVLSIVGLSLPIAVAQLLPDVSPDKQDRVVEGYRSSFMTARLAGAMSPLYPGAIDCLDALAAEPGVRLAIATGKSRRGLDSMLASYGIAQRFVSLQTADGHPSKPHPAMLNAALAEGGCAPAQSAMIGDTTYDMQMAQAAGVTGFGVAWGYHARADLVTVGAITVANDFAQLTQGLLDWVKSGARA